MQYDIDAVPDRVRVVGAWREGAKALLRRGIKFIPREDYCAFGRDSSSPMFARSVQSDEIALFAPSARQSTNQMHSAAAPFPPSFLRPSSPYPLLVRRVLLMSEGTTWGRSIRVAPVRPSLSRWRWGRANLCLDKSAGMAAVGFFRSHVHRRITAAFTNRSASATAYICTDSVCR